jgi:protein involved in polysaccharide export with SLBB domain
MQTPRTPFRPSRRHSSLPGLLLAVASSLLAVPGAAVAQFDQTGNMPNQAESSATLDPGAASTPQGGPGTVQLRQSNPPYTPTPTRPNSQPKLEDQNSTLYVPSEFEKYVSDQAAAFGGTEVRRFGSKLVTDAYRSANLVDTLPTVPGSYVIKPGDELVVTIWGAVDGDLHLIVDRSGNIAVPRVGSIKVAGLKYAEVTDRIKARVSQLYHNVQISVSIGHVQAIRVFVTGFVQHPGSTAVSGLASILHAVMRAGGPSEAGSFRDIRLTRDGKQIAVYDLYDLLLKGDRGVDELVQPDDVIFVGPIGTEVALLGSVREPAVFELKDGETLSDALRMAGGFTAVADRTRMTIERLADRATGHVSELELPQHANDKLENGDILAATSLVKALLPQYLQNVRIAIDGEVVHPGTYVLPPGSTLATAINRAGGLTVAAFPYGAEFSRVSVRTTQQVNYDRALRELETDMAKGQARESVTDSTEAAAKAASAEANVHLLARLRELKPTGRIVFEIEPDAGALPDIALEDGDSLRVPIRGAVVGVFGSVFNTGSFVFKPNRTTNDYLHLAGGPTRGADRKSMFIIRANGSVISALEGSSFWHSGNEFESARVLPGDTIFVPEELNKTTFVQGAKDWTQILYQFGLGIAGIKFLGN